jgi:hypothetical protein
VRLDAEVETATLVEDRLLAEVAAKAVAAD